MVHRLREIIHCAWFQRTIRHISALQFMTANTETYTRLDRPRTSSSFGNWHVNLPRGPYWLGLQPGSEPFLSDLRCSELYIHNKQKRSFIELRPEAYACTEYAMGGEQNFDWVGTSEIPVAQVLQGRVCILYRLEV
jgi:hypothetical protein